MFDIFDLILGPLNPFSSDEKKEGTKKDESDSKSFDFFPKDYDDDDDDY